MLNMLNQFYKYLSEKTLDYFYDDHIKKGDRFFIELDEDEQVNKLYDIFKEIGNVKNICNSFNYKHEDGQNEYKTFSLLINGVNLVVAKSTNIKTDFLVTLRNQVTNQEGVWRETALLIICNEQLDSISNGMRNIRKDGMPLSIKSITDNLVEEINHSKQLSKADKEITKFSLDRINNDISFEYSLWDFENILSIIQSGKVTDDDLKELELFKDEKLGNYDARKMKTRLKENHEEFIFVKNAHLYEDLDNELGKRYLENGVNNLKKIDWYKKDYGTISRFRGQYKSKKQKLGYIEHSINHTENGLVFWDKPEKNTTAGRRKRHIIVFNTRKEDKVILKFEFDQTVRKKFVSKQSQKYCSTAGKKLQVEFDVSYDEPTYKQIVYKHEGETNSRFIFNIVVLNSNTEVFDSIQSLYTINTHKKFINLIISEEDYEIKFGMGNKIVEKQIEDQNEKIYLYNEESIIISDNSPAWDEGNLVFSIIYNGNEIKFEINEQLGESYPVNSAAIWKIKRENQDNFVYQNKKAILGINNYNLKDEFKDFLNLEREIIKNDIFYGSLSIDGELTKIDVNFSDKLENAYLAIFNYFKTFDDSPEDNLPSLMYLNDDLEKLYQNFIDVFNEEIEEIENDSILADNEFKKDLLKIGRIDTEDKIMYSSFSPINIAYQLEVKKQLGNEKIENNLLKYFVSNNLIPYLISDDGNILYKPVYQEDAHEWTIYKKSDDVSIGSINVFIKNLVYEKLDQFARYFDYLFRLNSDSPLKINIIGINDDLEILRGVFSFIRSRLPDKLKTKGIIPVEIHLYNDTFKSSFDDFSECNDVKEFMDKFDLDLSSKKLDEIDILHYVQDNISFFKHPLNVKEYEYAHISFYKGKSNGKPVNDIMDNIETGLSLNGLLSSVISNFNNNDYRTGFGTKNILNKENNLVKTAININELVENSRNYGKNTYSKNKSVITSVELNEEDIKKLYDKSHWVTFIEPVFGVDYFNRKDNDLVLIHYADQYTSSSKYDTITVSNRLTQYKIFLKNTLQGKINSIIDNNDLNSLIKIFNCINGEWLLNIVSGNRKKYIDEKFSLISTIKYSLVLFNHKDIFWIPLSIDEILRIAENMKLNLGSILSLEINRRDFKDDLLLMGLKINEDNTLEVIYYPIEVIQGPYSYDKVNDSKKHIKTSYYSLMKLLKQINNEDNRFKNKFLRNFLMQIFLSNVNKFNSNHIWDEKEFNKIENYKSKLLNDDYVVSCGLEDKIGKGAIFSFKKNCYFNTISIENDLCIVDLPIEKIYSDLLKDVEDINGDIINGEWNIDLDILLSSVEDLPKFDINQSVETEEYIDSNDNFVEGDIDSDSFNGFDNELEFDEDFDDDTQFNYDLNDDEKVSDESQYNLNDIVDSENHEFADDDYEKNTYGNGLNIAHLTKNYSDSLEDVRVLLGTQDEHNRKIFWEFGHPKLPNRHMLIQGKSGQGKTYFIQRVLQGLSNQNIPSIIIDYTDGFKKSKLEQEFKDSLEDKLEVHTVISDKFPLNPFKAYEIEIDEGEFLKENEVDVASRFKSVVSTVYKFGDQQSNTIYNAVKRGIIEFGDEMDLSHLGDELIADDSKYAPTVLNKLNELLDINPFVSNEFNWSDILDNKEGKILIIQLTGLSSDIQKVITELILWDLWYYKSTIGKEENPFVVVLDVAQILDFGRDSPTNKILKEGRKYGWSGIFATQSIRGSLKKEELEALDNVDEKIYFHPTDSSISTIAGNLTKDKNDKKFWEKKLSKLNKGQCIVHGELLNHEYELQPSEPVIVNVDPIVNTKSYESLVDNNKEIINEVVNEKIENENQSLSKDLTDSLNDDTNLEDTYNDSNDYIEFTVPNGLAYKNHLWTVKRADVYDIIPKNQFEGVRSIIIDNKIFDCKISLAVRLFYNKNDDVDNDLRLNHSSPGLTEIKLFLLDNPKIEEKLLHKNNINFKIRFTNFVKKQGQFVIPREISQYFIPKSEYEDLCKFTVNGMEVTGRLNLVFRLSLNKEALRYIRSNKKIGQDIDVQIQL